MKIAKKNFELIITVGPSILKENTLRQIMSRLYPIFRLNGAHGTIEYVEDTIDYLRRINNGIRILLDLPGNKIRSKDILEPIPLKKKETFSLLHTQLNYPHFGKFLKKGDMILANDSNLRFEVEKISDRSIIFRSHSEGYLENNKGLHIAGIHRNIPFLFDKDLRLLEIAIDKRVEYIGLSFVRNAEDINTVKDILRTRGLKAKVIAKIEKIEAIKNLKDILKLTDYILIDRGDLSTEVSLLKLPYYQEMIIKTAKARGINVFVATQVLKNMQTQPVPLISEVGDLYNLLKKGIHGIQLSEETAIGNFPEECISLVIDMFEFVRSKFK